MRHVLVFFICYVIASKSTLHWTTTNVPNLPRADRNIACAAINNSIFIFGGRTFTKQLSEYIVSENRMVDHGEHVLSELTDGFGQYYTQMEHMLYITAHGLDVHHFSIYDLSTKHFLSTVSFTPIFPNNIKRGVGCCVAASDKHIFMTGGFASFYTDTFQIFELSLNKWYNGTSMQETRVDHACIVVNDFLYVIGGARRSSIEKININTSDFATQSWQYIQPLTTSVSWAGCLWYNDTIWIIGGVNHNGIYNEPLDTVHVIDVNDDSVHLLSERLPYAVNRACAISINRVLYVFGGKDVASSLLNMGMKYELYITSAVTNDPSYDPSYNTSAVVESTQKEDTASNENISKESDAMNVWEDYRLYIVIGSSAFCCLLIVSMICLRMKKKWDGIMLTDKVDAVNAAPRAQYVLKASQNDRNIRANEGNTLFVDHLASIAVADSMVMNDVVADMQTSGGVIGVQNERQSDDDDIIQDIHNDVTNAGDSTIFSSDEPYEINEKVAHEVIVKTKGLADADGYTVLTVEAPNDVYIAEEPNENCTVEGTSVKLSV